VLLFILYEVPFLAVQILSLIDTSLTFHTYSATSSTGALYDMVTPMKTLLLLHSFQSAPKFQVDLAEPRTLNEGK
jgi:hypothetical protein